MDLLRSVQAVAGAGGDGVIDWVAVADAAKAGTDPGDLTLVRNEREAFATDVRDARDRLRAVGDVEFDLPDRIEVQNRHHWIDANIATFERVMDPLERLGSTTALPGVSRVANTGTMAAMLAYLSRHVLGQYDPLLLADREDHALYFLRPNIRDAAGELHVDYGRFRRWIAFHEVAHAAEFGAAPWLPGYLETRMESGIEAVATGKLDREAFEELNTAMTAVEGYAELLMDQAFDDDYADLRRKLDERRQGGGPIAELVRTLLGLGVKRKQYERGAAFFEAVADERGLSFASRAWERPENLPSEAELEEPTLWTDRVA
jgi:uncharacterized protein (DUF2342 family)